MKFLRSILTGLVLVSSTTVAQRPPVIFDSDYGPFIDDVFALGLLLNSDDLIDLKLIVATSEQPELSAQCMAAQSALSGVTDIPVAVGSPFPPYEQRGSVCAIQGLMGFAMEPQCRAEFEGSGLSLVEGDGIEYMAQMLLDSERDDWVYLVVGGQSSLKALIQFYPEAAAKIDKLVVMAGNWCADFEPYPGVMAPTDETNIGCDPGAANFVLDANNIKFPSVYYVPVVMADEISGDDYMLFVDAANSGEQPSANATLTWYKVWSDAARADPNLLVHAEAMAYDPDTESTPQFDPVAVMLLLELLSENCVEEPRMSLVEMAAVHFFEPTDEGLMPFPEAPRSAYSAYAGTIDQLPDQCPNMTEFTFDPTTTPEEEYPIMVALGYKSEEAKAAVYEEMARRMAGQKVLCGVESGNGTMVGEDEDPAPEEPEAPEEASNGVTTSRSGMIMVAAILSLFVWM